MCSADPGNSSGTYLITVGANHPTFLSDKMIEPNEMTLMENKDCNKSYKVLVPIRINAM